MLPAIWFEELNEFFEEIDRAQSYFDKQLQVRRSWSVDSDMRVKSQVIDNKPFHPVRKIIK
ncbi:hypothetical protein JMA_27360 [Jeotgalibacillus malaysiensis]|uniref:Uncharacterized protein n=1 Tax=Jeotgalibacillus malaysiensis TaxID=1508404 RepID=A0A0B5AU01_9BACL|nr:hypothetical protein JMA_27360 [Jeotgalibacillus malaysiensis]